MTQSMYLWFPGNAQEALTFYRDTFDGTLSLYTYGEFGLTDGPDSAIAHGVLTGAVGMYGADAAPGESSVSMSGASIALLGTAEPVVLTRWFSALAEGGTVLEPIERRGWDAYDGQLVDRFGVRWLIGYETASTVAVTSGGEAVR